MSLPLTPYDIQSPQGCIDVIVKLFGSEKKLAKYACCQLSQIHHLHYAESHAPLEVGMGLFKTTTVSVKKICVHIELIDLREKDIYAPTQCPQVPIVSKRVYLPNNAYTRVDQLLDVFYGDAVILVDASEGALISGIKQFQRYQAMHRTEVTVQLIHLHSLLEGSRVLDNIQAAFRCDQLIGIALHCEAYIARMQYGFAQWHQLSQQDKRIKRLAREPYEQRIWDYLYQHYYQCDIDQVIAELLNFLKVASYKQLKKVVLHGVPDLIWLLNHAYISLDDAYEIVKVDPKTQQMLVKSHPNYHKKLMNQLTINDPQPLFYD